jgi:hypothetical protein
MNCRGTRHIGVFGMSFIRISGHCRNSGGKGGLPRREILGVSSRKKSLKTKDFFELYDAIWQGTAPIKYKKPDHALRECITMIKEQYGGPPF